MTIFFIDHAAQKIAFRLRAEDDNGKQRWVCEIDPHALGQWNPAGSGATPDQATNAAVASWNRYDTAEG